jgi:hypothetical protein
VALVWCFCHFFQCLIWARELGRWLLLSWPFLARAVEELGVSACKCKCECCLGECICRKCEMRADLLIFPALVLREPQRLPANLGLWHVEDVRRCHQPQRGPDGLRRNKIIENVCVGEKKRDTNTANACVCVCGRDRERKRERKIP